MVTIVVAAAIERDGRVLAARRSAPAELAGRWEFPGGKVEPGESDAAALARECREELGVEIAVGAPLADQQPITDSYVLRVYRARLVAGEPVALQDHDVLRWLAPAELVGLPWLPADRAAVVALATITAPNRKDSKVR
jgi:8-oxo-dGTP diphosphatase